MSIILNKEYNPDMLVCARATLNQDLSVAIAEESFYAFVGKNAGFAMDSYIYEDDVAEFKRVFAECDKEPIYVRVRRGDGEWRTCQFTLMDDNVILNGDKFYEIELRDMIAVNFRFSYMDEKLNKYRNILNLVRERFFEYNINTNMIKIYFYRDNRAELYDYDDLDEWKARIIRTKQVDKENQPAFEQFCASLRGGLDNIQIQFETSMIRKGDRADIAIFRGQAVYLNGEKTMVVGLIDVVNPKSANKESYFSASDANKDPATGLMNKKAMAEFAMNRISYYNANYANDEDKKMYMIIIDIDYFKNVNDTYGHLFGDEVIQKFASTIRHVVGERGMVGRIGGDEFFVLLEGAKDTDELRLILKTIRKKMFFAFPNMSPSYVFTCSIGVAEYRKDAVDYDMLFRTADKALYIAKDKGRDRFVIYDIDKHGAVEGEGDTEDRRYAMNKANIISAVDKIKMTTRIFDILDSKKEAGLKEVLDELIECLNIHGISIYTGEDMSCKISCGVYPKPIENAKYIFEENMLKKFNDLGVNVVNNIEALSVEFPNAYSMFVDSEICSTLQFAIYDGNEIKSLISMDIMGVVKRKWSDNDISLLYLIANRIGKYIV